MKKELNGPLAAGIIVVLVVVVGYFLWTRSVVPEPTLAPGQSLKTPFGTDAARAPSRPPSGVVVPGQPMTPKPGTVDSKLGAGPSANAPIPR